jgi:hypothetical protein
MGGFTEWPSLTVLKYKFIAIPLSYPIVSDSIISTYSLSVAQYVCVSRLWSYSNPIIADNLYNVELTSAQPDYAQEYRIIAIPLMLLTLLHIIVSMARHEYTMIALTLWGNIITNKDFTFGLCFKSIEIIAFPLLLTALLQFIVWLDTAWRFYNCHTCATRLLVRTAAWFCSWSDCWPGHVCCTIFTLPDIRPLLE